MKANITRGKSFKGLVRYVADKDRIGAGKKHAEYIGGTITVHSVEDAVRVLLIPQKVRKVKSPCYHVSLSLPKEERLTSNEWEEIASAFLGKMGIPEDTPWLAYRHNDTEHDHIHIVLSRVSLSGELYLGQFDALKAIEATQELEHEFGLTLTKGLTDNRNKFSREERKMIERNQELSDKQIIKLGVKSALKTSDSMEEFILALSDRGIEPIFNSSKNGKVSGISFKMEDFVVKGSQLGSQFSYTSLVKRLPSVNSLTLSMDNKSMQRERSARSR